MARCFGEVDPIFGTGLIETFPDIMKTTSTMSTGLAHRLVVLKRLLGLIGELKFEFLPL